MNVGHEKFAEVVTPRFVHHTQGLFRKIIANLSKFKQENLEEIFKNQETKELKTTRDYFRENTKTMFEGLKDLVTFKVFQTDKTN